MAAVLAVVGLVGCARGERDFIIGDESFSPNERAEIEHGAAFVAAATGKQLPDIVWGPLPTDDEDLTIRRATLAPGVLGDCEEGHFWVRLDFDQHPAVNTQSAAHELGHALGLVHIAPQGLMNPAAGASLNWSDADESSCVALGVCASSR